MVIEIYNETEMKAFGVRLAHHLSGGEVIELVGDVGAGKTTLVKGIAKGLGVTDDVQSPSFTINRVYTTGSGKTLAHYDFYRLHQPGIMGNELQETIADPHTVTVIEWGGIIEGVLPADRLTLSIVSPSETTRRLIVEARGPRSKKIEKSL